MKFSVPKVFYFDEKIDVMLCPLIFAIVRSKNIVNGKYQGCML